MKIYVCSSYDGLEQNYLRAIKYAEYVIKKGHTPICPVTMLHSVLNDTVPEERKEFQRIQRELVEVCDEIWVFGKIKTNEQQLTADFGKEVRYIQDVFTMPNSSEALSALCRGYETITGRMLNRGIAEDIIFYMKAGLTDGLIMEAIKKAAKKNAGWNYAEGILKNCMSKGITTAEEFERDAPKTQGSEYSSYDLDLYEKMLNNKE